MFQSYDYMSLFVSFFDIPVSLGNLFQRIASIYDRFYLSRLDKDRKDRAGMTASNMAFRSPVMLLKCHK